jgi:hypothetical protein
MWPRACNSKAQEDTNYMWNVLRQFLLFRVGQNTSRGALRMLGLGRFAAIAGLIGGYRYMRRHQAR